MFKVGKSGLFAVALAAVLALIMVACGNGEPVIQEVTKEVPVTQIVTQEVMVPRKCRSLKS